jgi:ubiquinone/menaquinone biosynthesis C-methylase UbiE
VNEETRLVRCIQCGGHLTFKGELAGCTSCNSSWPALRGIPDFRDRSQSYVTQDLAQAARLDEAYDSHNRDALVVLSADLGSFYHDKNASPRLTAQRIRVRQEWQRGARVMAVRLEQIERFFLSDANEVAVDIGTGSGPQIAALAAQYEQVVGIDASLSELLLAKKLLEEQKITNVDLACAFAEQLPIGPKTADFAVSLYVLEHVSSPEQALTEIRRVLKPGGSFYFAVPYRYTLIPPEPHTHVWWVGWLPRGWQSAYVRRVKPSFDFETIHLFSFKEVQALTDRDAGVTLEFFQPGFDADFPPANEKWRKLWDVLSRHGIVLKIAGFFLKKNIHAVMTLVPGTQ